LKKKRKKKKEKNTKEKKIYYCIGTVSGVFLMTFLFSGPIYLIAKSMFNVFKSSEKIRAEATSSLIASVKNNDISNVRKALDNGADIDHVADGKVEILIIPSD
jgi:hypothetical protein